MCRQYGFGVVADSFNPQTVAKTLNRLTPGAIDQMKHAALDAAQLLNADVELNKLVHLYQKLAREQV